MAHNHLDGGWQKNLRMNSTIQVACRSLFLENNPNPKCNRLGGGGGSPLMASSLAS
jgi:hypothetical protein